MGEGRWKGRGHRRAVSARLRDGLVQCQRVLDRRDVHHELRARQLPANDLQLRLMVRAVVVVVYVRVYWSRRRLNH